MVQVQSLRRPGTEVTGDRGLDGCGRRTNITGGGLQDDIAAADHGLARPSGGNGAIGGNPDGAAINVIQVKVGFAAEEDVLIRGGRDGSAGLNIQVFALNHTNQLGVVQIKDDVIELRRRQRQQIVFADTVEAIGHINDHIVRQGPADVSGTQGHVLADNVGVFVDHRSTGVFFNQGPGYAVAKLTFGPDGAIGDFRQHIRIDFVNKGFIVGRATELFVKVVVGLALTRLVIGQLSVCPATVVHQEGTLRAVQGVPIVRIIIRDHQIARLIPAQAQLPVTLIASLAGVLQRFFLLLERRLRACTQKVGVVPDVQQFISPALVADIIGVGINEITVGNGDADISTRCNLNHAEIANRLVQRNVALCRSRHSAVAEPGPVTVNVKCTADGANRTRPCGERQVVAPHQRVRPKTDQVALS